MPTTPDPISPPSGALPISVVERETGLSKDVLRKWESRYGFPRPGRDLQGERLYPPEQVARLRLIKSLMDAGLRPARLVNQADSELAALAERQHLRLARPPAADIEAAVLGLLRCHDQAALRRLLQRQLLQQGLASFVQDSIAPLVHVIGDAWARGELEIFEEHLFTEIVEGLLRAAADAVAEPRGQPRALLTTLPEEPHGLGILMVTALLALDGAHCVSLGTRTPIDDIVNAAGAHRADAVLLSFSLAYPLRRIAPVLAELRARLPERVEIWAGGAGGARLSRAPAGVLIVPTLAAASAAVRAWRAIHSD